MFNKNAFTIQNAFYFDVPGVRRKRHTLFPPSTNVEVRFNVVAVQKTYCLLRGFKLWRCEYMLVNSQPAEMTTNTQSLRRRYAASRNERPVYI